jgi:hypothetical protein
MAAPGWQTSELDEEWPDQSFQGSSRHPLSPPSSAPSSSSSANSQRNNSVSKDRYGSFKSIGTGRPSKPSVPSFRVVSGHTHNSLGSLLAPPPVGTTPQDGEREKRRLNRLSPPSSAGGSEGEQKPSSTASQEEEEEGRGEVPAGTFLVKETEDEGPQHLLRNPFIAKPGGTPGGGGGGGSLFQPLALESMFQPPSPSAEKPSSSAIDSSPASTSLTEPVSKSPGLSGKGTLRRASHSYVPTKPSRLSESMSPELEKSRSSSHEGSGSPEQVEDDGERQLSINRQIPPEHTDFKKFSGHLNSMQDVSFTFSPRREHSPGTIDPPAFGTGMSTPSARASLKLFNLRDLVAIYPVNDEKGLETPLISASRKQRIDSREGNSFKSWQSEQDLVQRSEQRIKAKGLAQEEQLEYAHPGEEVGDSTDEEMRERKPKRIRLDSPSVNSGSSSRFEEEQDLAQEDVSPISSGRQETLSFESSRSSASLNDTQKLKFHIGLISPTPRDGLYVAGNRQSWEQRGSAMLQLVRNQLQYEGNAGAGGMVSPSTVTRSGSEQTPGSSTGRDITFEGTVIERSGKFGRYIYLVCLSH